MEFAKKLIRLTEDRFRADVARAAGLPATAISNYINKGQLPRADRALHLAHALKVPLEWLVDDAQDWPPPTVSGLGLKDAPIGQLVRELTRRYTIEMLDLLPLWEQVRPVVIDRLKLARSLPPPGRPVPPELKEKLRLFMKWYEQWWAIQVRFNTEAVPGHHEEAPGAEKPPEVAQICSMNEVLLAESTTDAIAAIIDWVRENHARLDLPRPVRLLAAISTRTEEGRRFVDRPGKLK